MINLSVHEKFATGSAPSFSYCRDEQLESQLNLVDFYSARLAWGHPFPGFDEGIRGGVATGQYYNFIDFECLS